MKLLNVRYVFEILNSFTSLGMRAAGKMGETQEIVTINEYLQYSKEFSGCCDISNFP